MPSKKKKWSKNFDERQRDRDNSKEPEEPSKSGQQEGKENPSPGNEETQGACGTPADEKPGGSHGRADKRGRLGRKGHGKRGRIQGKRETSPDIGGVQEGSQNRTLTGDQNPASKEASGNNAENRPIKAHSKDDNINKQKEQGHKGRGRGESWEGKKSQVEPTGREKPSDSRNQDQRPGWPNPMSRNPCLLTQQSTRPLGRGVFPAKIAILDFKTLKEKDSKEVVQNLNEGMARLKFFLRSEEEQHNSDEFIYDLTCTLAKACRVPSGENTNKILAALKGSVFLSNKIPRLLDRVQASTALNDQVSRQRLIQCLIEVFIKYLMHLPSSYIDLPYVHLKEALHQSSIDKKEELQKELDAFKQARDDIIKSERQKHSKRFINRVGEKPPNDFRDIPICPTNKEVTTQERPFLRKNISKGRYEDAEHYLDVQFRLLREDFLEPLREGIHEIVLNIPRPQRKQLMKNYSSVQILSKEFTWSGVIHQVQINGVVTSGWGNSKRLLFGSFLCLSNDNFKTMFFATVSERDPEQLKNGRIDIQFLEEQDVLGIESRDCAYQMVESPAYFEAYRHVLKGLKQLDETTLPFKKYLVECSKEVDPPEYLRRDDTEKPVCYDLSNALDVPDVSNVRAVPVLQLTAWPSVKTLPLNSSQLEALRTAITTEFSVIQGPPGTGKTYVGAKIVKCLLENRDAWDPDPDGTSPMLMVCYTNHALDQFLEKVLEFRKKEEVIRVGGRCKSQIVEACNLKHLTGEYRLNEKRREVRWKMRQNQQEMKEWKKHLTKADSELLEFDDLEALLSPEHANQLYNAIFPSNVAIECRIPCNTFKLWLCNDERVGSCNKSATGEEEDQNERRPDRSILAESGTYLDDEGFNYASLFKEPHDVDENKINKTLTRETRDAVDESKEINKNRLEPKELFSEQQELKENSHHYTLLTSASFQQSSCSVEKCTHSPNVFAYGKQLDEIGDADKETIEIERETDLLQHQRWIQGDEDILSQEKDQEGANKENDDGWMTLTNRNKGKPFPWLKAKGENSKTESKGNQVLNAENEDHTGKTNSSENSMKKRNRASFDVKRELDYTPFGTVELTEVADNIEMTKNIRTESQHSGEKDEDISEVDEKTNAIEKEADLVQRQTRIQDDNDFLLPILEETGDLLNQAQNQGGKNEENDDEWINLITGTRGKKFFWLKTENENSKEENAGVRVLDAENEDETGKKKSSKKKKKKKKINRASLDVEHELDCTPMKMVGLREVADNIKITENSQTDNEHSGEKKDDDVSEAVEENIAFEREADLIQQQRRIQGDEELLLVISEETGELLSQEQDQGGANVEIDDQWTTTTLTNRKKGKAFPWLKKESENCKDERPGIQVLKAENENETGKTNSPKKRKKKRKKKIEVADNKSEETENPQRENEFSSEKTEDVRETDKETFVVDLTKHQRRVQSNEHRLPITVQKGNILSEEHDHGERNKANDEGWKLVIHKKKGKPFPWVKSEAANSKEITCVKELDQNKTGKTNPSKKTKGINITGNISSLKEQLKKEEMMSTEEAMGVDNIWSLSPSDRLRLYLFWIENYRERYRVEIYRSEQEFKQLCEELEAVRFEEEEKVIRQATVVGMTTSGAARYHSILQRIAPKIVVIEEAAEVMEAHIITSLSHNTKHAILIGDHKQLRPKATVYELARNYNLEVSLFERMVMNSMDCKRLSIQHRMRPEIAALTKRIYDHDIIDHESVCHFRDINGVCHNLFFVDHFHPESLMGGLQSYSNHHEAEFLVALCNYLLLQGYEGKQITILTMYTGQLLLLQQKMPREAFEGVKICAVDNFQGEENDIILLSLVRSNSEGRIGFLGESNRICVALSRARKGFYCIGNFSLLTSQSKLWKEICDDLKTQDAIGDSLQLVCKRHSNVTSIRWASDFSYSQLGGCTMSCGERLDCGHACDRPCHASDEYHEKGHCSKMCINLCPNNHKCPRRCHYPKECKCYEFVLKTLPLCGHEQPVKCSIDPNDVPCRFKCEKTLKCGHNCQKPCGKICTKRCTVSCTKTLPCGHEKSMLCYKDPMVHYQCNSSCAKVLECGHPCSKRCTDTCQCDTEVEAQLPCEHRIQVLCRKKDNPVQCKERCKRTLDCGHDCPGICHEECKTQECRIVVFKELLCGHQQSVSCFQDPQTAFCFAPCPRQLNCGHMCSSVCGRLCHEVQCKEFCQKKCERGHSCQKRCHFASSCDDCMVEVNMMIPLCGHSIKTPCYVDPATLRCKQRCERVRVCGHSCEEICSKNCEARPCKVPTPRLLSCNHVMTLACHKNPEKFICEKVVEVKLSCGHKTSLKCHVKKAALERVLCKEQMEKELRCGHKLTLPCFKNPEDCICRNKVNVELPCGHTKSVQCSTVTAGLQNVSCTVKIKRKLPCDHEVTLPCHKKLKEYCCQEEVEITLLCGHSKLTTCSNKGGELQNGMCKIKVTRKLPCGHEKVMQCSDRPDKIFCDAPCEHFFPCGHPCPNKCGDDCAVKCTVEVKKALSCGYHNVSCPCSEDVSQLICSNQCTRKLMCGHLCPGKCFQRCNKYKCQKWVNKSLNCAGNHSLRMYCKDDPNCVPCQERCTRKLDCDHPCPGLCSEPCDSVECRRRIKKIHPCGHEEEIWCFQRKAATCKAPCRRQGSCKHMCKGVCGEPCSKFPCKEAVCKTLRCGHKVMMPCSYSVDDVQCPASCGAKLQCGHQCSGICDECKQRGSHEMCQNPCNRLLVCSHRCQATCSEPCPPCNRNCDRRCPHGKCKQRCSQLCEPCKQPCKWNCFHYQCKNLCEEECDRPRCDAACPKKLPCRHPCIGLCGENCPTVCAICHAKKLLSMLGHGSDKATEASRYLQLFDCGHIVSVKEMDAWMFRKRGSDVQLIRCPRCSTPITFSYRYGNIIKRTLKNIENVKKQIRELGNEKAGYSSNLLKKLRHRPKGLLAVVEKLSKRPCSMELDKVPVSNIPFVFTLRNNLLVLHQVEKAHHILQNVEGRKENSKEQLQITEHSRTIKDALESISKFLNKPQLDLTTLNQMHEHTRKFTLFAVILESQCEAIKHQISFSRNGKTCLQSAQKRFHLFIQGHNDALHIDWLENIVALLRKEVGLTSVPPEEPKVFENFPGFNKGVWKLCKEHRQVYLTRSLMRNGEDATEVSGCGQCVDMTNREEGAVGWSFFNFF